MSGVNFCNASSERIKQTYLINKTNTTCLFKIFFIYFSPMESQRLFVPEDEKYDKDGEYFKQMGLWVLSRYNTQYPRYTNGTQTIISSGQTDPKQGMDGLGNTPVGKIERLYQYYDGKQPNVSYAYAACDEDGLPLPTVWINGQKIHQLIDHAIGKATELLSNVKVSARSYSPAANNKRTERLEKVRFYYELKALFNKMGMEQGDMGVSFSPLGGAEQDFDLPEDAYEYLEKNYKEVMEEIAYYIATDAMHRNKFEQYFKSVFKQGAIGGISATECFVDNNKTWWKNYEPYAIIWDNDKDDELNKEANFVGLIEYMTPIQIIEEYGITKEKDAEAYKILTTLTTDNYQDYQKDFANDYFNTILSRNNTIQVAVVRTYWRAAEDTRYVETEPDKYGNRHVVKSKKKGESNQYWMEAWYRCDLIGTITHKNYGKCNNNVERIDDDRRLECPVKVWIPNINLGASSSMTERLYQHQDRKDFLNNEITKMLNVAFGKVGVFRGSKLNETTVAELTNDFKRYRFTVLDDESGDFDPAGDVKQLFDMIDMTLDPQLIGQYRQLMLDEDTIMEEYMNVSKVSLGMQGDYISLNTQQSTIAQSNIAALPTYKSFMYHICDILQFTTNVQKNIFAVNGEPEDEIPLLGDRDIYYLKSMKDVSLEAMGIKIKIDDTIDEASRIRVQQLAQAAMQNGLIDFVDVLKLEKARTFTEAINILENSQARKKRDQEKQQAMMQQMQQIQQQQAYEQQAELKEFEEGNKNQRAQMESETKLANTFLQSSAQLEGQQEQSEMMQ